MNALSAPFTLPIRIHPSPGDLPLGILPSLLISIDLVLRYLIPVSRLPIPGTLFLFHPQVYAVVVSHEQTSGDLSPAAVSYTSGFYSIPVIGISSRDAAFSDKNIHVSFLRTVPPYYHQADVWLEMLSHFAYTKVRSRVTHP